MIVRPVCGGTGLGVATISLWAAISLVVGTVLSVYGLLTAFIPQGNPPWLAVIAKQIVGELEKDILTFILNEFGVNVDLTIISWFSAPTPYFIVAAIVIAALLTAASMIYWAWYNWSILCGAPSFGTMACVSGVVNNVVPALSTPHSVLFGFTGNQPRADVVVKSIYWTFASQNNPAFVLCAPCDNCPATAEPPDPSNGCSPEIPCYYHSSRVCGGVRRGPRRHDRRGHWGSSGNNSRESR